jgi:uncharacterized protein (DUF427 family)
VAWTYDDPLAEVGRIAGRVAFFAERAEVTVDGAPVAPPRTPWATR